MLSAASNAISASWRGWFASMALAAGPIQAVDEEHVRKADASIERGIAFLHSIQGKDGSWSPGAGPAVTAMVVTVMLDRPALSPDKPAAQKALAYILSRVHADGGIHDGILQNYNTAICLSALTRVRDRPEVEEVIGKAHRFLGRLQWYDQLDPDGVRVTAHHPYYGGAGYGKHGRPDLSNTQMMLQGLYDAGLAHDDPIFQRALAFIGRCQGTAENHMFGDRIVPDGGFIYSTSISREEIGVPQSMAGYDTTDAQEDKAVSRLRTYGSMTYAGFKSYVYANLHRDDPQVVDAWNWIRRNYSVDHNPGMPPPRQREGYFYYLMTMARALDAWGNDHVESPDGVRHNWANDLIAKLVQLQRDDGSWVNGSSRWMETDPNLVTAYALIALTHAQ